MIYFLVGFMGAGKTKVGQSLSKTLNLKFIDLDKQLKKEKTEASIIFFLQMESFISEN